jgi:hypothetical protein
MIQRKIVIHFVIFFVFVIGVIFFYANHQPQIKAGEGKGWDGKSYYAMYQNYQDGGTRYIGYPFFKRIGSPYLAHLISNDAKTGFLVINIISGAIASYALFWIIYYRNKNIYIVLFCIFPILFYLSSPIRASFFEPFTTDPPVIALLALSVLFFENKQYVIAASLIMLSTVFRETGVYYLLIFNLFITYDSYKEKKYNTILAIVSIFISSIGIIYYQNHGLLSSGGNQLITAFDWLKARLLNPVETLRFFAALSLTIGPFIYKINYYKFKYQDIYLTLFLFSILMSFVGGSDITRIFYMSYPVYVIFLVKLIEKYNKIELFVLSVAGLNVNRFLAKIPEPQNYWPDHDTYGLFILTPDHSEVIVALGIIIYWIIVYYFLKIVEFQKSN